MLRYFGRRFLEKLYVRTWLGWVWIPLRPILDVGTRVLIFGSLLKAPSNGVPYLLFLLVGSSAWQLFADSAYWATRSIELNRRFLRRLYLPRLILVLSALAPSAINFGIYVVFTVIAFTFYAVAENTLYLELRPETVLALAGLAMALLVAISLALWTSVFGAEARDVRFTLGYVLGFWYFLTPVIYPLSAVPGSLKTVASLNPMTAPIELVRLGVFDRGDVLLTGMLSTTVFIAVVGGLGLWFFDRSEARALDTI
jgi:lipopolysaccharide transport system permease protein